MSKATTRGVTAHEESQTAALPAEAAAPKELAPNTFAGQRHIAPTGRHSQQSHLRAEARAKALGLTTVRELYEYDRAAVLAKLKKGAEGAAAQLKAEQNRRAGVAAAE